METRDTSTAPKSGLPADSASVATSAKGAASAKAGPKDVFLHLLAILTLYASATALGTLLFQYIDLWLPDPLEIGGYYRESILGVIRWAIATLVIVFPVYAATTRYLNKQYAAHPEKRDLRTRKWLLYFTLFAAAAISIGDLVALVYHLLSGEITVRFLLKVATILLIAGSVGYYYLTDLRRHRTE